MGTEPVENKELEKQEATGSTNNMLSSQISIWYEQRSTNFLLPEEFYSWLQWEKQTIIVMLSSIICETKVYIKYTM